MKIVNISIVLFCTPIEQLETLFQSVKDSPYLNEVICVDNSPNEELRQFIENQGLRYIRRPENLSYGAGHNVGIKYSIKDNIPYHLIVNPDVFMHKNALRNLVKLLMSKENIALCVPRVIDEEGKLTRSCKLLPTPLDLLKRLPLVEKVFEKNSTYELGFLIFQSLYGRLIIQDAACCFG